MPISYSNSYKTIAYFPETSFTCVRKYSVAATFVFYCDAKHSDILQGSSHTRYLFIYFIRKIIFHQIYIIDVILFEI